MSGKNLDGKVFEIGDFTLTQVKPDSLEGERIGALKKREGKLVTVFDFHNYLLSGIVKNSSLVSYDLKHPTRETLTNLQYHDVLAVFDMEQM